MRYLAFLVSVSLLAFIAACDSPTLTSAFLSEAERKEKAQRALEVGIRSLTLGEREQADRQLRQAANLLGAEQQGFVYIAQRLLEQGEPDKAGLLLEEVKTQSEYRNNPFVFGALAQASRNKGDTAQASELERHAAGLVREAERFLAQPAPTNESDRLARVSQLLLTGRYALSAMKEPARGVALLRKAVALNPGEANNLSAVDSQALSALGVAIAEHPTLADEVDNHGVPLTRLAAQAQPESAALRHAYGWALFLRGGAGDRDGAQRVLREAADMDQSDPEIHYHLGIVYAAQGKIPHAMREFECTLWLRPHHAGAEAALKALPV